MQTFSPQLICILHMDASVCVSEEEGGGDGREGEGGGQVDRKGRRVGRRGKVLAR